MPLRDFIEHDLDAILSDWSKRTESARGRPRPDSPIAADPAAAAGLLSCVATDIDEIYAIAEGRAAVIEQAEKFAAGYLAAGVPLNAVIDDLHALRCVVTSRWCGACSGVVRSEDLRELLTFDESLDLALAEACRWYIGRTEEARELFNGVLAHDLRTPLSAILASAELLMLDDTLDQSQAAAAARIRASGTRMRKLIEDLLDFTRTRLRPVLPITLAPGDIGEIVRSVVGELGACHPGAQIHWTSTGESSLLCDTGRLEQMISNLLGNAVEHGKPGGPVAIHTESRRDTLTIRIQNLGAPIPQEELQVLFHPLVRAAVQERMSTRPGGGLGLGLYIARQIAEAHGGTISATSTPGDGTTFVIGLPRRLTPPAAPSDPADLAQGCPAEG